MRKRHLSPLTWKSVEFARHNGDTGRDLGFERSMEEERMHRLVETMEQARKEALGEAWQDIQNSEELEDLFGM